MAEYQLTATDAAVIRTADGAFIPNDPANRDYAEYLQWLEAGGVPDPYVPPPTPEPPPPEPDAVSVQMKYRAKTVTQAVADPGNGFIGWNTAAQSDASKLAVASRDDSNLDQGNFWRYPGTVGKLFIIQHSTDAAQVERFEITGVTDNGTWFDVDVSPLSSTGGPFAGNNPLYVLLGSTGAASSPSNYVTQQQFAELQAQVASLSDTILSVRQ